MKKNLTNRLSLALAILSAACCGTARADLGTETTSTATLNAWLNDPNGHAPFYEAANLASGTESGDSQPSAGAGASYTVLSETFSITNGAGVSPGQLTGSTGASNYVLTGIGMLISGSSTNALSIHLFDVTSNIVGTLTASSVSYDFTANGDLLGGGNGLSWVNNTNSGAEMQVYLPLTQGPNSYDQVVLGAGHIYTLEVWTPTTNGAFLWFKTAIAAGAASVDAGGLSMGSHDASFTVSRTTISALGQVGSAEHNFGLALYATATTNAASVNTNLSGAATTNYLIDAFNAFGYGASNSYVGTNDYSIAGGIDLLWTNWFGSAWVTNLWDNTMDAGGNTPHSGSLEIVALFPGQYLVGDYPVGISNALNAETLGLTSFQCDILFSNNSAVTQNGSFTNYGHLQFGMATSPAFTAFDAFGSIEIPPGTTNWTHVNIPISVLSDPNLTSINNVIIKIDGGWYSSHPLTGSSILWVDNIKFVGPAVLPTPPKAPTLGAVRANPGLRIFAASTINTYDREELDTVDQNQSWVYSGAHYPVTYSFTLQDFPIAPGMQCHLFLVPVNSLPSGNSPTSNEYVDYQASNNVWLDIIGGGLNTNNGQAGYAVNLFWKTNTANANAANQALVGGTYTNATNQSAVGTWSLIFSNASSGALVPPQGVGPLPFTIADPNIAADFANPVIALIGLQPNSTAGEGTYIDYAGISITGVVDGNEVESFVNDYALGNTSITSSGLWDITDAVNSSALQLVNATTPLWLYWTLPDIGFGLGVTPIIPPLPANFGNTSGNVAGYVLPLQYDGYTYPAGGAAASTIPAASRAGGTNWTLIPNFALPSYEYTNLTNAYFQLMNPVPPN